MKRSSKSFWFLSSWNAITVSLFITLFPAMFLSGIEQGYCPWFILALGALAPAGLVLAVDADRELGKQIATHLLGRLKTEQPTGDRDYVLYLRSFAVDDILFATDRAGGANLATSLASHFGHRTPAELDGTWGDRLAALFRPFGPVVAAGRPGEPLPLPGPQSFYLPPTGDEWRQHVSEAISRARLVVVVAAVGSESGLAEGTLWEYTEALRLLSPSRLVLALCGERDDYERFCAAAESYFDERASDLRRVGATLPPPPVLPDWPEMSRPDKLRTGFPLRGVIRFEADWMAEAVPFDPSAERGPTPYARWRRTVRRQVAPWVAECESLLPGQAVCHLRGRYHWQIVTLAAGLIGWLGFTVLRRWDGLPLSHRYGLLVAAFYLLATLVRLSAILRTISRSSTAVRLLGPGDDEGKPKPTNRAELGQQVAEYMVRWPGRLGIGLCTVRYHSDKEGRPAPVPSWSLRRRITRRALSPFTTLGRWPAGVVHRGRTLETVERDPDADLTSRHFGYRALTRLACAVGTAIGTVISLFLVPTAGQMASTAAIGLLVTGRFWYLHRKDLTWMGRLRLRPRVPEDLAREPCVLYLRPHPDDPLPCSPWQGPLDLDLAAVFNDLALFRTGFVPQESRPPTDLARLHLPAEDWQDTLTTALPLSHLVVISASGTTAGTLWQLTEAVRLLPPSRLLLVLPTHDEEGYERFRSAAAQAFAKRAASLPEAQRAAFRPPALPPELPPPVTPVADRVPALYGVIHFTNDWAAAILCFDPLSADFAEIPRSTQLLCLRVQLKQLLTHLNPAKPPRQKHPVEPSAPDQTRLQ
ncbi:hypothetical protein [Streptomyces agglomeratus]|uniref:hypothetical protein n=1 Tax=Streptomyces agglomeratus TaxID=285458 RepID=UPI000854C5F7|nr:hypothetical protein [Streptomyces agglomeratus]OEJ49502.1 hypothetical protein BGK72_00350 [Streptomyces agglomeratus]